MSVHVWVQSSTASCWQRRRRWTTRTRRSRPCMAAWLKQWSPRSGWSREWWSFWRCPSTACLMTHCRPGFRWVTTTLQTKNQNQHWNLWESISACLYVGWEWMSFVFCEGEQHTLILFVFNRNLWMKTKVFKSRMRAYRPRSLHRYICQPHFPMFSQNTMYVG